LRLQLQQVEGEMVVRAAQHQETVRRTAEAANEEKKLLLEELLKEKETAKAKEKEATELKCDIPFPFSLPINPTYHCNKLHYTTLLQGVVGKDENQAS